MNESQTQYNVLAPGPVNLHPKIREALALPMIHHRTPEFDQILNRVLLKLKQIFKTEQPAFILSSTGSGGMEALLVNLLNPKDKVIGINSGKFGERWCEMAEVYGAEVLKIDVPWGKSVQVADVETLLKKHPDTKLVLCQACETSTGVVHPIRELGALIKNYPNTLFLVDAITGLGAFNMPMDEWHLDGVVGGSQKAFMLPTGLSLFSFSQKAWKVIEKTRTPRFYFDVRKELKANKNGETFFSSNVTLTRALDVSLDLMLENGLDSFFKEIAARAQFVRESSQKLGLQLFAENPSNSVTALRVPEGIDSQKLRLTLEKDHHITIMGGQDRAKGQIIRIGHMGYITQEQQVDLMLRLRAVLLQMKPDLQLPDEKTFEKELRAYASKS